MSAKRWRPNQDPITGSSFHALTKTIILTGTRMT